MTKPAALQIITANRLRDGAVVYLGPDTHWSTRIGHAVAAADEDQAKALLAVAARAVAEAEVVAPYAIAVAREAGGLRPASYRERLRAAGPSIAAFAAATAA